MKYILLLLIISLANCTQNFISYIKTPHFEGKNISAESLLLSVGLIDPVYVDHTYSFPVAEYPTGTLVQKSSRLAQNYNTIQVPQHTHFEISVNTRNHLIANPYYASEGIIYQADKSTPNQGKFIFVSGEKSGQLKIRIYTPEGILQSESTWYVEVTTLLN